MVRLVKGQEVNLGCGALIVIAIIVAVCSGAGKTDLGPVMTKLDQLDQKVQRLEKKLDEISKKPQQ
jgi:outer membrane murein-binding lipoprotein Lpp